MGYFQPLGAADFRKSAHCRLWALDCGLVNRWGKEPIQTLQRGNTGTRTMNQRERKPNFESEEDT
jgi:hypothetical protein